LHKIKISGRHTSIPKELKRTLSTLLPKKSKVIMNNICSCRHNFSVGSVRIISYTLYTLKIKGYYGSGIADFFIKFYNQFDCQKIINKFKLSRKKYIY